MIKAPLNLAMLGDPQAAQYCDMLGLATTFAPLADPECSTAVTPLFRDDLTDLALDASGTFTRASTAYHQQPTGEWRAALSGEARMSGARRVRNLATSLTTQTITVVSGNKYQVAIKGANGATAVCSGAFTGTLTADGTNYISWASGTPKTSGATSLTVTVTGTLTQLMVEDVTVQTNQNPSSWVDGSTSHGANVNGVQYLKTANGNTVDGSGIVTEATGAALSGPFGLLMEPADTNQCLYSSLLSDWSIFSLAGSNSGVAGPFGVNYTKLLPNNTNAVHAVYRGETVSSNVSLWLTISAKAATYGFLWIECYGASTADVNRFAVSVNLSTGAVAGTYGSVARLDYIATAQADGGWRIEIKLPAYPSASVQRVINISPTDVARDGRTAWLADGASYALAAGVMLTANRSSHIATAGSAVARAVDALSYTGVPADNETRLVIDGANVDSDDWNGTVPTPTAPERLSDVLVYAPGGRPA